MSLSAKLTEKRQASKDGLPKDIHATMMNATKELSETNIVANAPKVGEKLLTFKLPNASGTTSNLQELLKTGPVVLTFYRGGWCPYCNLELQAYQAVLNDINAAGVTLIAVTPELPDESLSTSQKNKLAFEVLTDKNSEYARELGLVFTLPEKLRPIYSSFGIDVEKHNGKGQFDFPLAATFVVGTDGIIIDAFVDADYTQRKEPSEIVKVLNNIS